MQHDDLNLNFGQCWKSWLEEIKAEIKANDHDLDYYQLFSYLFLVATRYEHYFLNLGH